MPLRLPLSFALLATAVLAADLPVREVILYKHGVGYFERAGTLAAGEPARLDFKPSEMNDVLKSLTVTEPGGTVSGLRYDAAIPLDQRLSDFPFTLQPGQPLTALLDQLKGAQIELTINNKVITGAIVGARLVPGDKERPERQLVTLLLDSGSLTTIELADTSSLRFPDPKLQLAFKDYLAAVLAGRSKEKRSLYIDSNNRGDREIRVRYMMPAPMWKSSYRLIFPERGDPSLEGWAIVDNTTGEDWTGVKLSLVSGKPISFVFPLYEPRMLERAEADLPEDQAVAPVLHSGAVSEQAERPGAAAAMKGRGAGAGFGPPPALSAAPMAGMNAAPFADRATSAGVLSSVAAASSGREIADLFEYRIDHPVTVRKDQSAMLPFLQQKIAARKLLIYSDPNATNPQSAAELTNTSGKTLDGGPITIFDGGAYAGEALVETVKAGDKRLISYAVDLGTRITTRLDSRRTVVREIHVNRGVMDIRHAQQWTRTYTIKNADPKPKTLVIEHPIRPEWTLVGQKPQETSPREYRFEVPLQPGGSATLPVTEENLYSESTTVSSLTPDVLVTYVENKALSAAARQQLQPILDLKRRIAQIGNQRNGLNNQVTAMAADQQRLREIMMSLGQVNGQQEQVQKYARDLAAREEKIGAARAQENTLREQQTQLETELNGRIASLDF